jgi:predicted acetyltransferase
MKLVPATLDPPPGLMELLIDVGDGENGFGGTPVHNGKSTLEEYLQACIDMLDEDKLPPEYVPQTMFWAIDDDGLVVGMVRMRHYLNDKLLIEGGHIGYYIKTDQRGKGYGTEALRLALAELAGLGEPRALVTVDVNNAPSIKVIEANGGVPDGSSTDLESGREVLRYWIELTQ